MRESLTTLVLLAGILIGCSSENDAKDVESFTDEYASTAGKGNSENGARTNVNYSLPSYEESLQLLQQRKIIGSDENPPQPIAMPQPEDEGLLGLSFYRMGFESGADLSGLSITRTFFGRSEISDVSFRTSDLTESNLRWNDFIDVDFNGAILVGADLRASIFIRVSFDGADLSGADLRRSDYQDCTFIGANFSGAMLAEEQRNQIALDEDQVNQVAWQPDHGPEPSGG